MRVFVLASPRPGYHPMTHKPGAGTGWQEKPLAALLNVPTIPGTGQR